jgi:hypothetical protein
MNVIVLRSHAVTAAARNSRLVRVRSTFTSRSLARWWGGASPATSARARSVGSPCRIGHSRLGWVRSMAGELDGHPGSSGQNHEQDDRAEWGVEHRVPRWALRLPCGNACRTHLARWNGSKTRCDLGPEEDRRQNGHCGVARENGDPSWTGHRQRARAPDQWQTLEGPALERKPHVVTTRRGPGGC